MTSGEAVMALTRMGFQFRLQGSGIMTQYAGHSKPDPDQVAPLWALVRKHKDEVRYFLRSYCSFCGGCVSGRFNGQDLCMGCGK